MVTSNFVASSPNFVTAMIAGAIRSSETSVFTSHIVFLLSVHRLLVTAKVPSSPILVTLMMEALLPSEMSVLTRATWHNIPELLGFFVTLGVCTALWL
jgi:hypothetical protein